MDERPHDLIDDLVMAHRILVEQNVLDAFGHVSVRDPKDESVFWLASALPPSRVNDADMLAFSLDGEPVEATDAPLFSERFIHSSIYRMRPDVHSICHHHAASIFPFCITDVPLIAVSQTGAFMGSAVPLWDSRDMFGATRMLVETESQGDSLGQALGEGSIVLMRGHGATVAGRSIADVVFKSVFACRDAEALLAAGRFGTPKHLWDDEIALAGEPARPALERAWRHWTASWERRRNANVERKTK